MNKRMKRALEDVDFVVRVEGDAPAHVLLAAVVEKLLDEIGLSTEHLEALGFESEEIQIEVLRIMLAQREDAWGSMEPAKTL
jgi:spore coat polysaccharide biosynthesis protein SpsF (cytidylyltransferase family)